MPKPNAVYLYCSVDGRPVLWPADEFSVGNNTVIVHPTLLARLSELTVTVGKAWDNATIKIVRCAQTRASRDAYAKLHGGYIDEGGDVSRVSLHDAYLGGIAADITLNIPDAKNYLPALANMATPLFDHVALRENHVHVDLREAVNFPPE